MIFPCGGSNENGSQRLTDFHPLSPVDELFERTVGAGLVTGMGSEVLKAHSKPGRGGARL